MEISAYKDSVSNYTMHNALAAIAKEIQGIGSIHNIPLKDKENKLSNIVMYKHNIKLKNNKIKRLNQRLLISCCVSKILIWTRQKEVWSKGKLNLIDKDINSSQSLRYFLINNNKTEIVKQEKLDDNLTNETNKGDYEGLQKMLSEPLSVHEKLIKMISFCQHNFSKTCVDCKKCELLEQKSRFYKNKINILESNLKSLRDEMKNLNYQVKKLQKENDSYKSKLSLNKNSDVALDKTKVIKPLKKISNQNANHISIPQTYIKSHLSKINNLLFEQQSMLQVLQELSEAKNI